MTVGRPFVKGQKNPNPNTKLVKGHTIVPSVEMNLIKKLTVRSILEMIQKFSHMKIHEIEEYIKSSDITVMEAAFCRTMIDVINTGDHSKLDFILNRSIGKVKDKIEHSIPKPTVIKLIGEDAAVVIGIPESDDEE